MTPIERIAASISGVIVELDRGSSTLGGFLSADELMAIASAAAEAMQPSMHTIKHEEHWVRHIAPKPRDDLIVSWHYPDEQGPKDGFQVLLFRSDEKVAEYTVRPERRSVTIPDVPPGDLRCTVHRIVLPEDWLERERVWRA